ncbi:hypothetical protein NDU88_005153 [Pleurodeles waltl]|uniref:Uncharacterized protein n=1 Tax=Pleurodeles waltl TaxID=8319 RepID=A0AAV7MAE0_PLEWA|nr:hypothetical protein NDU88_005153 [Pleurodeles waltl]
MGANEAAGNFLSHGQECYEDSKQVRHLLALRTRQRTKTRGDSCDQGWGNQIFCTPPQIWEEFHDFYEEPYQAEVVYNNKQKIWLYLDSVALTMLSFEEVRLPEGTWRAASGSQLARRTSRRSWGRARTHSDRLDVPPGRLKLGIPAVSETGGGIRRETPALGAYRAGAPPGAKGFGEDSPAGESRQSQHW